MGGQIGRWCSGFCTSDFDSEGECSTHSRPTTVINFIICFSNMIDYLQFVRIVSNIGAWCNGNTTVFGAVVLSSNLGVPTIYRGGGAMVAREAHNLETVFESHDRN